MHGKRVDCAMLTDKNICDEFEFDKMLMALLFTSQFGRIFAHQINWNEEHFSLLLSNVGIVCTSSGIFWKAMQTIVKLFIWMFDTEKMGHIFNWNSSIWSFFVLLYQTFSTTIKSSDSYLFNFLIFILWFAHPERIIKFA